MVPYGYRRVQLFYRSALLPLSQKLRALQQLIFLPIFLRHVQVIIYHQILQEKSCRLERLPFTLRDASGLFRIQIPSSAVLSTSLLCRETQKITRSFCPQNAKKGAGAASMTVPTPVLAVFSYIEGYSASENMKKPLLSW